MHCGGGHLGFPIGVKMAATAGHRLTLDPMGKCSNAFFSETTNMMKAKLYINVHNVKLSPAIAAIFHLYRNKKP
jgi:hypothetical protein